jgi:aspartate/glutamate racemase
MNIYQLQYNPYHDIDDEQSVLFLHTKKYTQSEFQDIIKSIKFSMGHFQSYHELIERLEDQGFQQIITGYFLED